MQVLDAVPPEQLPDAERRWLDAAVPLPGDVTLLRRHVQSMFILLVVLAVPFACGLVFAAMDLARGRWSAESSILFPIFLGPFLVALWVHWRRKALERALAAGRKRLGLFLGSEALLVALEERRCTLIPRAALEPAASVVVLTGKSSRVDLVLPFKDERGGRGGVQVEHHDLATERSVPELVELVNRWREPRPAPVPAPQPAAPEPPLTDEELWSRHKY